MKTMVYERYGAPLDVLEFKDVEKPIPKDNEVLVKTYAASLNAGDWHFLRGETLLRLTTGVFLKPRHQILGDDIAGRVEAGKVIPVIDRRFPLSEGAQALQYLEEGHARGKVIITTEHHNIS